MLLLNRLQLLRVNQRERKWSEGVLIVTVEGRGVMMMMMMMQEGRKITITANIIIPL